MFHTVDTVSKLVGSHGGRWVLGAVLAAAGSVSTARAHDNIDLRFDGHGRAVELERRHWDPPVYEDRQTRVWVEPVFNTVPGQKVFVQPVYRTVVDHVWREPVVENQSAQVWVEATYQDRETRHGHHARIERVLVPAHFEVQTRQVVVTPGHYDDVPRQELVVDGHWEGQDQQVLVTPGHFETRTERVCVREGHWDQRPIVRIEAGRR